MPAKDPSDQGGGVTLAALRTGHAAGQDVKMCGPFTTRWYRVSNPTRCKWAASRVSVRADTLLIEPIFISQEEGMSGKKRMCELVPWPIGVLLTDEKSDFDESCAPGWTSYSTDKSRRYCRVSKPDGLIERCVCHGLRMHAKVSAVTEDMGSEEQNPAGASDCSPSSRFLWLWLAMVDS